MLPHVALAEGLKGAQRAERLAANRAAAAAAAHGRGWRVEASSGGEGSGGMLGEEARTCRRARALAMAGGHDGALGG